MINAFKALIYWYFLFLFSPLLFFRKLLAEAKKQAPQIKDRTLQLITKAYRTGIKLPNMALHPFQTTSPIASQLLHSKIPRAIYAKIPVGLTAQVAGFVPSVVVNRLPEEFQKVIDSSKQISNGETSNTKQLTPGTAKTGPKIANTQTKTLEELRNENQDDSNSDSDSKDDNDSNNEKEKEDQAKDKSGGDTKSKSEDQKETEKDSQKESEKTSKSKDFSDTEKSSEKASKKEDNPESEPELKSDNDKKDIEKAKDSNPKEEKTEKDSDSSSKKDKESKSNEDKSELEEKSKREPEKSVKETFNPELMSIPHYEKDEKSSSHSEHKKNIFLANTRPSSKSRASHDESSISSLSREPSTEPESFKTTDSSFHDSSSGTSTSSKRKRNWFKRMVHKMKKTPDASPTASMY